MRKTMPARMMRLVTALSLKAGGAKKAQAVNNRPEGGRPLRPGR